MRQQIRYGSNRRSWSAQLAGDGQAGECHESLEQSDEAERVRQFLDAEQINDDDRT